MEHPDKSFKLYRPDILPSAFMTSSFAYNPAPAVAVGSNYGVPDIKSNLYQSIKNVKERQERWRTDCHNYFLSLSKNIMMARWEMANNALYLHDAYTLNSKVPEYVEKNLANKKITMSSIKFDYINKLPSKVKLQVGSFMQNEYKPEVYITNKNAISVKHAYANELAKIQFIARTYPELLSQGTEQMAQAISQLDIPTHLEKDYRNLIEVAIQNQMNDWYSKKKIPDQLRMWREMYEITQTAFAMPYIDPMTLEPVVEFIHPLDCIFDTDMTDDNGKNMQYFIYMEYMPIDEVLRRFPDRYKSRKEILDEQSFNAYKDYVPGLVRFSGIDHVVVSTCRWKYVEHISMSEIYKRRGIELPEEINNITIPYEEVYESQLIGFKHEVKGGIMENQVRSADVYQKANLGVFPLVLGYARNPLAPNNFQRISGLVKKYQHAFHKLTEIINDIIPAILEINATLIPEYDQDPAQAVQKLVERIKSGRIVIKDTSNADIADKQQPMVQVVPMSVPAGLNELIGYIQFVEKEINDIISFNESLIGNIDKYQTSTNAALNFQRGNLQKFPEEEPFEGWIQRILEYVCNLFPICNELLRIRALETNDPSIIDMYVSRVGDESQILMPGADLFNDYGLRVKKRKNPEAFKQEVLPVINAAFQSGGVTFEDYLDFLTADDPYGFSKEIIRRIKQREEEKAIREQQAALQMQEMQRQARMEELGTKAAFDESKEQLKGDIALRNSAANAINNQAVQERANKNNTEQ